MNTSIFDSALSHTRRSDASKKGKKIACPLLDVFACGQVSSPRLYRLKVFSRFSIILECIDLGSACSGVTKESEAPHEGTYTCRRGEARKSSTEISWIKRSRGTPCIGKPLKERIFKI